MNEIAQTGPRPNILQVRSSNAYGEVVLSRLLAQYSFGRPAERSRNRNEAAHDQGDIERSTCGPTSSSLSLRRQYPSSPDRSGKPVS